MKKVFLFLISLIFLSSTVFASSKMGLMDDEIISADELHQEIKSNKELTIFDARDLQSYNRGHIEGAILPLSPGFYDSQELFRKGLLPGLPDRQESLRDSMQARSKEQPIVTYCNRDCGSSAVLLYDLKRMGFKNVRAMLEGYQAWEEKGYPVAKEVPAL